MICPQQETGFAYIYWCYYHPFGGRLLHGREVPT